VPWDSSVHSHVIRLMPVHPAGCSNDCWEGFAATRVCVVLAGLVFAAMPVLCIVCRSCVAISALLV
jgi:hypothetical protein